MTLPSRGERWTRYRRTQIAEMTDWTPNTEMTDVSISEADRKAGSPKAGDKIAHNPKNHEDRWLIAADYFSENFEPLESPDASEAMKEALAAADEMLDGQQKYGGWWCDKDGTPLGSGEDAISNCSCGHGIATNDNRIAAYRAARSRTQAG